MTVECKKVYYGENPKLDGIETADIRVRVYLYYPDGRHHMTVNATVWMINGTVLQDITDALQTEFATWRPPAHSIRYVEFREITDGHRSVEVPLDDASIFSFFKTDRPAQYLAYNGVRRGVMPGDMKLPQGI